MSKKGKQKSKTKKKVTVTKKTASSKKSKRAVNSNSSNNILKYNSVQSAVSKYLKSLGKKYTKADLVGNTKALYRIIKDKSKSESQFYRAIQNIDVFIEQYFHQDLYLFTRIDSFDWWLIQDRVSSLHPMQYIIVDSSEVVEGVKYDGLSYGFGSHWIMLNREINYILKRKLYANYVQLLFRDDELKKEFMYFILMQEGDERENYDEKQWREWIVNNKIDLKQIFEGIDEITETSLYKGDGTGVPEAHIEKEIAKEDAKGVYPITETNAPHIPKPTFTAKELIGIEKSKQKTAILESKRMLMEMFSKKEITKKEFLALMKGLK